MGIPITSDHFSQEDYERFGRRLGDCLAALDSLLQRPGFGGGPASLGAELELSLVDAEGRPMGLNREVIAESADPRLTVELDRFNLECNLRHGPLAGRPFEALRREIEGALGTVTRAAARHGARPVAIGILPTLEASDLGSSAMTDTPRFRALSAALQQRRAEPFHLDIRGEDRLELRFQDVTFEGAATSLQLHLRISPGEFTAFYNAVQLVTAPALAVAGNSPTFLGRRLWDETRVALFKQAVDDRPGPHRTTRRESRVSFGTGWLREGPLDLFASTVAGHDPLLPVLSGENPLERLREGAVPGLEEMRLHAGTVWRWNRPVYDPTGGGHLRIEMRALPAGPSPVDMLANAAFLIGAALGLAPDIRGWTDALAFEDAHRNFYRAARHGLAAALAWPQGPEGPVEERPATAIAAGLVETARRGLAQAGVEADDAEPLLDVVAARVESGATGAAWQRRVLAHLEERSSRREALVGMLERYLRNSESGEPVHRWEIESR